MYLIWCIAFFLPKFTETFHHDSPVFLLFRIDFSRENIIIKMLLLNAGVVIFGFL